MGSIVRDGELFEVECRLRRGDDGSYRWFLCRALPLRDETGKITRWFGTCTDVHDQRRATEGLSVLAEASAVLATSVETDDDDAQRRASRRAAARRLVLDRPALARRHPAPHRHRALGSGKARHRR